MPQFPSPGSFEMAATMFFAAAVIHTFLAKPIQKLGFHWLGEVELIFGYWAALLLSLMGLGFLDRQPGEYLTGLSFAEPIFVGVVMTVASARPALAMTEKVIGLVASALPISRARAFYFSALVFGPALGSLITEPAAMTVTALLLRDFYFSRNVSDRFKYVTLGLLFVNVSIGGTLTHFAAPPVVMIARPWGWDSLYMLSHFGWKALVAILLGTLAALFLLKDEFGAMKEPKMESGTPSPWWRVQWRGGLMVALFLAGLVVLGGAQKWWLQPLISSFGELALFLAATALTAVTDNAALTFLGAQVEGLSESMKYALVAGAVTGGGLTVIANAPNPVGFSILQKHFGDDGIGAWSLFKAALPPTVIASLCFWFL